MDIPKKLKVTVKASHIRQGKCEDATDCAIAKAIKAKFRGKLTTTAYREPVTVDNTVRVNFHDGSYATYKLTDRANRFITAFDRNKKNAKPRTFLLPMTYGYTEQGGYVAGVV